MVDPYAPRRKTDAGEAQAGAPRWLTQVQERGGVPIESVNELLAAKLSEAAFICIVCRGAGLMPPVARVRPRAAAALLLANGEPRADAASGNLALEVLERIDTKLYAIKHGWVAGPEDRAGAIVVSAELVAKVLDAAAREQVSWETDPDFGYEIAARVPSVNEPEALALSPRLLYTALGRVYEHATLVPALKRERREVLEAVEGLDPAILSALG